jgi:non-heme Fe2+,alpha-ketoglutarate-dependent halogenase
MPRVLSGEDVQHYRDNGFVTPISVLCAADAGRIRAELERCEQSIGHPMDFPEKSKSYLLFNWADELVHHPTILDAVEDLIGPDILVYHSTTWIKEPKTPAYVLWHQDGKYFHLQPHLHVTAWIALSDVSVESGCVHVLPGSHKWGNFDHQDDLGEWNMIKRGQGISGRFDDETGVPMALKAGQMSLHHTDLVHCSRGNGGTDRRIGLGISYIPASVRQYGTPRATALPVRGRAKSGEFEAENRLRIEMSAQAVAAHAHAVDLFRARQDIGSNQMEGQRAD